MRRASTRACQTNEPNFFWPSVPYCLFALILRRHMPYTLLCVYVFVYTARGSAAPCAPPRSLFWRDISRVQHRLEHTCPVRRAVGAKSELEVKHPENRAHLPVRKVILCILPKEFEFLRPRSGPWGMWGDVGDVGDVWHHRDEVVRVSIREAPLLRVRTCLPHFT